MKQGLLGLVLVLLLAAFAGIGIAHIFKPDYFVKQLRHSQGRRPAHRVESGSFQIAGAIFAALYLLYVFFRG